MCQKTLSLPFIFVLSKLYNVMWVKMKPLFFGIFTGFFCCLNAQIPTVSIDTMLKHLTELTAPKYEGRLPGTSGYDLAKDYTVNLFKMYGLKPYNNGMVEEFFTEANVIKNSFFETDIQGKKQVYELGKDYACRGFSGSGDVTGNAVFCGYGVSSDGYDDYENVDVKDKIVVIMKGVPSFLPDSIKSKFFYARDKARIAEHNGAKAIVIITMPEERDTAEVQGSVMCGKPPHLARFPMIQPHYNCGKNLFATEKESLPELLQRINETKQSQSFTMLQTMHINVEANYNPKAKTYNVVGMIEGSDPKLKDEYIIFGAHLDHVGKQGADLIFPGADDNGSGTVAVLEIARIFNLLEERPKRSIVFVLFACEESGLTGATHFVKSFAPIEKMIALVNMDCIGNGDSIRILGAKSYPKLWQLAFDKNAEYTQFMPTASTGDPGADATPFMEVGIPCIYFTNVNGYQHLHQPGDTVETINPILLEKHAVLCLEILRELGRGNYHGEK
jgi:hypothetical protein